MPILPISNFRNYNVKPLSFNYTHNNLTQKSDKHVTTKDIPYSYPIAFKGKEEDMKQILADSNWAKKVFKKYGIKAEIDEKDGLLTIEKFEAPYNTTYKKLGVDVARLIKNVKKIEKFADFSFYTDLCVPNLEVIEGDADCSGSKNIEFTKLKSANNIYCNGAKSIKFPELTTANDIYCHEAENIEFSKLTAANKIYCWIAEDIKFSKLTTAYNIDLSVANNIEFSELTTVNKISYYYAKSIKLPEQIIEKMNVPRECIAND